MLGDRVVSEGIEFEVIWCGASDRASVVPSLLDEYARPSALAEPSIDKRRGLVGRMTAGQIAQAKRELREFEL